MKLYITTLVNKSIVIIWSIHCDCVLPVRKIFCNFCRSAGVKRLRTTALHNPAANESDGASGKNFGAY